MSFIVFCLSFHSFFLFAPFFLSVFPSSVEEIKFGAVTTGVVFNIFCLRPSTFVREFSSRRDTNANSFTASHLVASRCRLCCCCYRRCCAGIHSCASAVGRCNFFFPVRLSVQRLSVAVRPRPPVLHFISFVFISLIVGSVYHVDTRRQHAPPHCCAQH